MSSPATNLWPRVSGAGVETPEMSIDQHRLLNALKIIPALDFHEIAEAGFRGNWPAFRDDPFRQFLRMSDADQAAIFAAIERRQPAWLRTAGGGL